MNSLRVILVFDVGKTNKKLVLFDELYRLVLERPVQLPETVDEDGDACEDLKLLTNWVQRSFWEISSLPEYEICAVSFSAYGASFVHVDDYYEPVTPLYNYLKPYPEDLKRQFYDTYGGQTQVSLETASPVLGNLNSGLQLYRLKYRKPDIFDQIKYSLHLPQFLSYLISAGVCSDITSIGCHTHLWDFSRSDYHEWVYKEGIDVKLAPIYHGDEVVLLSYGGNQIPIGVGLHDSSAALIPYLASFQEPFVLISTGTWCISLNPFNQSPLSEQELRQDCLFYITYEGKPVKASRLFAGYEHEQQTRRLSEHFQTDVGRYQSVSYDRQMIATLKEGVALNEPGRANDLLERSLFGSRDLSSFGSYEQAYHQLMSDLLRQQQASTELILQGTGVKRLFVDGGFSKNAVYMNLLAAAFPDMKVYAASVAHATAMGAALAIRKHWNRKTLPGNIIDLEYYAVTTDL
ncbi:MAG: FGGY-family carbohydrate kinase [Chitinophagaceae bacterium]